MALTVQQMDEMLNLAPGFRVVDRVKINESGVDPIGLRQLNLDLMDASVPGINNVTTHIRPYAFMTWAWWKAANVAIESGASDSDVVRDLASRYEAMFAWSHSLAERPLRGVGVIRKYLPLKGSDRAFIFKGGEWEALKQRMTSLMAPTEYGPSIKALRWLAPSEGGIFRRSIEAEPAVAAIEQIVSEHLPQKFLGLEPASMSWEDVVPLAEHLHLASPTTAERDTFRHLFYESGARPEAPKEIQRRKATIDLLRAVLSHEGRAIDLPTIRRRLATGWLPESTSEKDGAVETSSALLTVLQARQLQRLAIEAMMVWVERNLSTQVARARHTDELATMAEDSSRKSDPLASAASTVADYMKSVEDLGSEVGWPGAAANPDTDVLGLLARIQVAQTKDLASIPGLCLRAFAVVRAVTKGLREKGIPDEAGKPLDARADRLPMGVMSTRINAIADKPLSFLWRDIIEHWIIAQHVHWSAIRGADGKKRLRIGLESNGWILVRDRPSSSFGTTPDRLFTLLSLGTECGLFTSIKEDGVMSFGVPAS